MNPHDDISAALDQYREQLAQDPNMAAIIQEVVAELSEDAVPVELLEELILMFAEALKNPEIYPQVVEQLISSGVMDADDVPPEFDAKFVALTMCALDLVRDNASAPQAQGFARGGLAQMGRNGDTMLAHINPIEARMLLRNGGSGSINPATGLPEFGFFKKLKKVFKKILKPVLTIASIIPGPWQVPALAINAAYSASQGNWLGAALSAFGAYAAPGGFGGFGEAGATGSGITGGIDTGGMFGSVGGATAGAGAGLESGAGLANSLSSGAGAASSAGSAASSIGSLGSGISGGLELGGLGLESLGGVASGAEALGGGMEAIGGLGDGVSGSIPSLGESTGPSAWDMYKTAKNIYGPAKTAYSALNPPEPEEYSQRNTQSQMQQLGGAPTLGFNTNKAFGLGGTQSRGMGQMSNLGMRFRNGGLARCTCKGK